MKNHNRQNGFVRAVKKFILSAFVVVTFTAYALENRANGAAGAAPAPAGTAATSAGTGAPAGAPPAAPTAAPTATAADSSAGASAGAPADAPAATATTSAPAAAPTAAPTATSPAPALASSGYKDGTYKGPAVDVNWGYVQVQATIQGGKINNVQFLQYPNDRRTSQRINYFAVPALQQEAVQTQSANVDIITGATLTSEGFQMSLQYALNQAKG